MRPLVLALLLATASGGCNFAVKHPSTTVGIVVGAIGVATCSLTTSIEGDPGDSFVESPRMKCYGVSLLAGVAIGGIAAFAQWLGYEDDPTPAPGTGGSGGTVGDPTNLPPAPVFVPKTEPPKTEPPKTEPPKPEPPKSEPQSDPAPQPTPTP